MELRSSAVAFSIQGIKSVGVFGTPSAPEGRLVPAVLMLHGFPGSEQNVDIQRDLMSKGIAAFRLHFQGAWGSEGEYRFSSLVEQARAGLSWLAGRPGIDPNRLGVFGFSMGGWAALNLIGEESRIKLAAAAAPAGGPEMISDSNAVFIESHCAALNVPSPQALTKDFQDSVRRFDPAASAAKATCSILLIHGSADPVIPPAVSKKIRAQAGADRCRLVIAEGGDHAFLDRRPWLSELVSEWFETGL